jgi:hypothetical protein
VGTSGPALAFTVAVNLSSSLTFCCPSSTYPALTHFWTAPTSSPLQTTTGFGKDLEFNLSIVLIVCTLLDERGN